MLLSGHIDGDRVPLLEVEQLTGFNLPAGRVAEVLADLGLLDDHRAPARCRLDPQEFRCDAPGLRR